MENVLNIKNRKEFRTWLRENGTKEKECWIEVKRGKPTDDNIFWYIDAVEEAICFGWIDSTTKALCGKRMQRFSPRKKKSVWSELNKERARRLIKLGLMTDIGLKTLPDMECVFKIDEEIKTAMKNSNVWEKFNTFPPLYQRVRVYNVGFYKNKNPMLYKKALDNLIEKTKQGKMFGEWNDYGRLL